MKPFYRWHPALVFLCLFVSALLFGLSSFNLFHLLKANIDLVIDNGVMALKDGAFDELLRLFLFGIFSLVSYLAFKVCEKLLVESIASIGKK